MFKKRKKLMEDIAQFNARQIQKNSHVRAGGYLGGTYIGGIDPSASALSGGGLTSQIVNLDTNQVFYRGMSEEDIKQAVHAIFLNKTAEKPITPIASFYVSVENRSSGYGDSRRFALLEDDLPIIRFNQIPYPECCGIALLKNGHISTRIEFPVFQDFMNKLKERLELDDRFGKYLFYTTENSRESTMFKRLEGIEIIDTFINPRTGNPLIGFSMNLVPKNNEESEEIELSDVPFD